MSVSISPPLSSDAYLSFTPCFLGEKEGGGNVMRASLRRQPNKEGKRKGGTTREERCLWSYREGEGRGITKNKKSEERTPKGCRCLFVPCTRSGSQKKKTKKREINTKTHTHTHAYTVWRTERDRSERCVREIARAHTAASQTQPVTKGRGREKGKE